MSASLTIRCDGEVGCWQEIRSTVELDPEVLIEQRGWKVIPDAGSDEFGPYVCPACQNPDKAALAAMVSGTRDVLDWIRDLGDSAGHYVIPCTDSAVHDDCILHVHSYERDTDEGPCGRIIVYGARSYRAVVVDSDDAVLVGMDDEAWQ